MKRIHVLASIIVLVFVMSISGCTKGEPKGEPLDISSLALIGKGPSTIWAIRQDEKGNLLRSSDQGKTFRDIIPKDIHTKGWMGNFFLNAKQAWIIDSSYSLYQTLNGGRDWKKIASLSDVEQTSGVLQILFHDVLHGWLRMNDNLYSTEDGGTTWKRVAEKIPNGSLDFTTLEIGWSNTMDGVYKTEDGGRTWNLAIAKKTTFLFVNFVDKNFGFQRTLSQTANGILSGDYRITSDGGSTWRDIPSVPFPKEVLAKEMYWYDFVSKYGIAVSYGEKSIESLYSTMDQGRTWRSLPLAKDSDFTTPYLLEGGTLLLVGGDKGGLIHSISLTKKNSEWKTYQPLIVD
ncbi:WD40/YVTN/BNR-like repeat-containing protein [Gorillibacterium timonense]|uniref:WD40/YVTN/BNR-like repeat-containing protein n=1 Tax=Gorillibacterium timonense TaxID=1689269 RepID=UPI00131C7D16|nr:YCF48-related protein [Gorillibacterium timonense]